MVTFWQTPKPKRASKYNAKRAACDLGGASHWHQSLKERKRHFTLQIKEERGEIRNLKCHTKWPLEVNGMKIGVYTDDFDYEEDTGGGQWTFIVEDVKGKRTREYQRAKKLVLALYNIAILET